MSYQMKTITTDYTGEHANRGVLARPHISQLSIQSLLLFFSAYAWAGTAILMSRSVRLPATVSELEVAAGALVFLLALSYLLRLFLPVMTDRTYLLATHPKTFSVLLIIGVLLRFAWAIAWRPQPMSDGLTYVSYANQILTAHRFGSPGSLAYWPPGYAIFLTPFLLFFSTTVGIFISQTILFMLSAIGIQKVARSSGTLGSANVAVALFVFWPNLIAIGATPEKELLVIALVVWAVHFGIKGTKHCIALAGFLLGCSALVQPGTQLLIPLGAAVLLWKFGMRRWILISFLLLGAALAVGPWTARNYAVFGQFKLISTNGGDVLYRANNPLANGGYTSRGEIDLSSMGELEREGESKALAVKWIFEHPAAFIRLGFEKELLFIGDDTYGVYATFRHMGDDRPASIYSILKLAANFWWLLIWLAAVTRIFQGGVVGNSRYLILGWLYLFALHSVFESGGRYHIPMIWVMCISLGELLMSRRMLDVAEMKNPILSNSLDRRPRQQN